MSGFEIRPRFSRRVKMSLEELLNRLEERWNLPEEKVKGYKVDHHVYLSIPEEDRHFWSPQLALELIDEGDEVEIRALFGPSPSVWLMFIFVYSFLGFLAFVVLIIGGSRWNLGMSAGILWFIPVLLGLVVLAIITAKAGQRLGHEQMHHLYGFLNRTVIEMEQEE
ncbi:MAG: hypothetical protein R3275_12110 [Saprospiraceae bacterium]|nr:hypothetical protein [Saprospiraceae bacterium]